MKYKVLIIFTSLVSVLSMVAIAAYQFIYLETISGKIIIVQKDAKSNMMALVQVAVISQEDAKYWRDAITKDCFWILEEKRNADEVGKVKLHNTIAHSEMLILEQKGHIARLQQLVFFAQKIWQEDPLNPDYKKRFFSLISESRRQNLDQVETKAITGEWQDTFMLLKHTVIPQAEKELEAIRTKAFEDQEAVATETFRIAQSFDEKLEYAVSMDKLSRIPKNIPIVAYDRTDDTGRFKLRLPRGDYYVIADAERTVFSSTESYYWAQPISVPSQFSEKCLLGNMNTVDAASDDLWQQLRTQIRNMKTAK